MPDQQSSHGQPTGEAVLVALAQVGHISAYQELVKLYERRLAYYARRLLGPNSEADDALQEIWMLVYRKLPNLQAPEAFQVWLYRIAHDVCVDHLRRASRAPRVIQDTAEFSDVVDTWDEFEAIENADLVHQTLEELSSEHREVLTLRFLEQMDLEEIAHVVECAVGTVKSRLYYAKLALRARIEERLK